MLSRFTLRQWLLLVTAICLGLLGFGLYLQHVVGLEPCPMCIVQRYAMVLITVFAGVAAAIGERTFMRIAAVLSVLFGGFGAFVAARQSWLQWYPPEQVSCGRDFYGMIETFPLQRAIPLIFKGSGDCTKVDWSFMGASIANWSFVWFVVIAVLLIVVFFKTTKQR
jgi:protein dithiol:quinone oxidoreductase